MKWQLVIFIVACCFSLMVNLVALCFMLKNMKLRKSRFYTLVLNLSFSDSFIVVQSIILIFVTTFNNGDDAFLYACMVFKHSSTGTLCFSIWQTTMICLERLQATFHHKISILNILTSNQSVGISSIACHLYTTVPLIYEITQGPKPCDVAYTLSLSFTLSMDVPLLCYYLALVALYSVVIIRMAKRAKTWMKADSVSHTQTRKRLNEIKRLKINMITLGSIIIVTSLAILPRLILSLVSIFVDYNEHGLRFVMIGNMALFLNPLLDPIIYVLCIKEVRRNVPCCLRRTRVGPVTSGVQLRNLTTIPSTPRDLYVP